MRKIFKRLIVFTMFATVLIPGLAFAAGNETSSTSRVVNTVEKTEQPTRREIRKQTKQIADSDKPSLAGCQFGVYSDEDATNLLDIVEIKEVSPGVYEGVNKSGETLPAGKVYVKEIKAAKGYLLNKNVYPVTIKAGETIPLTIPNDLDIAEPVLNKTSDIQKVRIGSTVKYTITMTNPSSTGTVYNAVLEDSLSAGDSAHIVADSVKANIDGTNFTDFTSTESSITSSPVKLGPGQVLTMTYNVKVTDNLPNGVLRNALSKTHLPGQVFNVTTSVENGTIDPSKVDLAMNSNATINYQPKDGYRLSKVYVDGAEVNKDNFTSSYTFSNIDQDHRIHVVYEPNPNVEQPVKTFDKQSYHKGETVKNEILVNQSGKEGSTARNVVVTDKNTSTLKINADTIRAEIVGSNGSSQPKVSIVSAENGEFTVTVDELKGGDKIKVTFDGEALNTAEKITNTATVTSEGRTQSITAEAASVYKIKTKVTNGTIDPNVDSIPHNSDKTINYQPKDGYQLKKIVVDGKDVDITTAPSNYTFSKITGDHEIEVIYEGAPKVGTPVKTFDKQSYNKNDIVKNEITAEQKGNSESIAKNIVISDKNTDTLKIDTDTIKAKIVGTNGSSEPVVKVINKETGEFTVSIAEFKGGDSIKITFDGKALNTAEKITNVGNLVGDNQSKLDFSAEANSVFKIKTKVTNGTIDPDANDLVYNSNKKISYQPKEGYELEKVTVDGKDVDKEQFKTGYDFNKITDNHEIEVIYKGINKPSISKQFDKKEYSIGETIKNIINFKNDGNTDAKVKDATVSDTPGNGVKINTDTIKVNYNGLGKYVINIVDKVTGAFNVVFDFFTGGEEATITYDSVIEKNVETIENTASAEGVGISKIDTKAVATPKYTITTEVVNGNISPNQEVVRGGDSKIEYTPKDGYKLKKITVDGNEVEKSKFDKEYNFTKVNDNHKIKVEYEGIPHPTIKKTFDKESYKVGDTIKATVEVAETGHPSSVSHNVVVADANQTGFKIKTDTIKATVSKSTERKDVDEKPQVEVVDAEKGTFNVKLASLDSTQKLTITYDMEITRESGSIKNKATLKTTEYPNDVPSEATGKLTFDIGTKVTGGKITPPVNDVPFGSNTKIEYTPDENHYLDKILIDGKEVKKDKIEKSYTFEKIENNHNIEVIYKKVPTPTIEKKSDKKDYIKGDIAKYTVKVTNGDSEAENVVLADIFEKEKIDNKVIELDKSSIKINGESVPYSDKYTVAKLAPKAEVVLTYEAKILEDGDNTVKNDASVIAKGMTKEIVTENVINTHEIPKLDVDKTSDKKSYRKNETIKYSVKITNNGKFAAHNLKIKDFITKGSDYVKLNNDFAIDGKEAKSLEIEKLEPGKTVEITYSGKVMKDVSDQVTNKVIVEADYMEMEKDGNGKLVPKNPPSAENTVEIEKTPTPENIKTGDAQNVLTYVALGMSALLTTLIIAGRKLKKN